jgi:hypothetical protein
VRYPFDPSKLTRKLIEKVRRLNQSGWTSHRLAKKYRLPHELVIIVCGLPGAGPPPGYDGRWKGVK